MFKFEQTILVLLKYLQTKELLVKICNAVMEKPNTVSQNPNAQNDLYVNALNAEGSQRVTRWARQASILRPSLCKSDVLDRAILSKIVLAFSIPRRLAHAQNLTWNGS